MNSDPMHTTRKEIYAVKLSANQILAVKQLQWNSLHDAVTQRGDTSSGSLGLFPAKFHKDKIAEKSHKGAAKTWLNWELAVIQKRIVKKQWMQNPRNDDAQEAFLQLSTVGLFSYWEWYRMNRSNLSTTQSADKLQDTNSKSRTALCLNFRIRKAIWFAPWISWRIAGLSSERMNWDVVEAFKATNFPSLPVLCLVTNARSTSSNDFCKVVAKLLSYLDEDPMRETTTSLTSDFNSLMTDLRWYNARICLGGKLPNSSTRSGGLTPRSIWRTWW